jgi:hypothetical protein
MEKDSSVDQEPVTRQCAESTETRDITGGSLEEESSGHVAEDVVGWDGDYDVEKPLNWSTARKVKNIVVISYTTFLTYEISFLILS